MQVVDKALAIQRAGGRQELAAELHGMLLKSVRELKEKIEASWSTGDRASLLVHVHKLNGSTRYCGAPQLESSAETLEASLKAGADDVGLEYRALIAAMDALLAASVEF